MLCAAWWFALSPNLLAHGALVTMETPLAATSVGVFFLFWRFLVDGRRRDSRAAAALAGLAFSCKFTAVLWPPLLALVWWVDLVGVGTLGPFRPARRVAAWMLGFVVLMLAVDFLVTGGAAVAAEPCFRPAPSGFGSTPKPAGARETRPPLDRNADSARLGRLRHPASTSALRRAELPVRRPPHERLAVLLFRRNYRKNTSMSLDFTCSSIRIMSQSQRELARLPGFADARFRVSLS